MPSVVAPEPLTSAGPATLDDVLHAVKWARCILIFVVCYPPRLPPRLPPSPTLPMPWLSLAMRWFTSEVWYSKTGPHHQPYHSTKAKSKHQPSGEATMAATAQQNIDRVITIVKFCLALMWRCSLAASTLRRGIYACASISVGTA